MTLSEAKEHVRQVLAEADSRGLPMLPVCVSIAAWLDKNGFELPASLVDWLEQPSPSHH